MKYLIYIVFFNIIVSQIHFFDLPDSTGVTQMVIIENIIGLDPGDEVGLFDANGLLSFGEECIDEYGELLVGSGVYDGNQMNLVGISSQDYCDFEEGFQLPGFIEGNPIVIKVWDASEDIEYIPEIIYNQGSSNWVEMGFCAIDLIVHNLSIDSIDNFSLFEIYPNPFNSIATFNINHNINNPLEISIFDISGGLLENFTIIKPLYNQKIIWDASNYDSGIYIINFESSNIFITKKISLIK